MRNNSHVQVGPQANAESDFQTRDAQGLDPRRAFQNLDHDGVVEVASPSDLSQAPLSDGLSQVEGESAHHLGVGLDALDVRPVGAQAPGRVAAGSGHASSLSVEFCQDAALTSTAGDNYSQSDEGQDRTVAKKIETFTPKMDAKDWALIQDFVRGVITDAQPSRYETAGSWMSMVAALTLWTVKVERLPQEREVVLHPQNTFAFIEQRPAKNDKAQATARSILLRISARVVGENLGATEDRRRYAGNQGRKPYTAEERTTLRMAVLGQATAHRRRNLRAIVGLAAGAGLTSVDLMALRFEDVIDDSSAVLVNIPGPRARTVPVLAEWEDLVRAALRDCEPGSSFVLSSRGNFRYGNAIADFLYSCNGLELRPHVQRLRSTWFHDLLVAGTPVNLLLEAAGVTEVSTLQRYLCYLQPVAPERAVNLLRNEESA